MGAFYGGYGYIATVTLVPAGLIMVIPPLIILWVIRNINKKNSLMGRKVK